MSVEPHRIDDVLRRKNAITGARAQSDTVLGTVTMVSPNLKTGWNRVAPTKNTGNLCSLPLNFCPSAAVSAVYQSENTGPHGPKK